ncbi:hypothetical protein AJ79_06742 [Helicocarpus griseus UAMH5409]|uniref:Protein kinase domain-containing protein n=1 Tax=Helicocarpus griseus UAMH5409 TaxID=1447875 RepID=A0A2B7X9R1_9EURO|nr:hypothetical protein AJ79_06742 [Helicocarpus griseus UAMH5409]
MDMLDIVPERPQEENLMEQKLRHSFGWRRREDTLEDPIRGLIFEYIEGQNIDKAYITEAAAKSLRDQLNHLHSLDIGHGDLFPRNIMVSNDGRALLIDFSSAKIYPHIMFKLHEREIFEKWMRDEKRTLELVLFRLRRVSYLYLVTCYLFAHTRELKRHEGMIFSEAQTEEEAFGGTVSSWADGSYSVVE